MIGVGDLCWVAGLLALEDCDAETQVGGNGGIPHPLNSINT